MNWKHILVTDFKFEIASRENHKSLISRIDVFDLKYVVSD